MIYTVIGVEDRDYVKKDGTLCPMRQIFVTSDRESSKLRGVECRSFSGTLNALGRETFDTIDCLEVGDKVMISTSRYGQNEYMTALFTLPKPPSGQ